MGKLLEKIKTKAIERLTDDFGAEKRVVPPTNNGSIHSLADVDIHTITDRISRAYSSANIGTWAYTSEINLAMYHASMEMNRSEKETTLNIIGCDAAVDGDGTVITPHRNQPHTTAEIDYVNTFQAGVEAMERQGFDTTQQEIDVYNNGYYSGLDHGELNGIRHNDLYTQSHNLYYDDDNKLYADKVTNVIQPSNPNSIVSKTKQLFNENKINTIVSAFHTKPTAPMKLSSAKTVKYGMSHGRNLLLKSAERGDYANYDIHGYDNPYCRVWTHHYQYNRRDRLIRPFVTFDDSERENTTSTDIAEWHNFARQNADWKDKDGGYAWKGGNAGWELSVLHNDSKNGTVNIAPKYSNDPNHKTIKPIDCMFSIENLAWQGYDPYSFQKALSNEQRGPMGGRIMWFPPYDIRFSESVNVNWNPHDFIGRGETVHTYKNTSRSGSLSFKILVDHPSYTDLMLHHDGEITTGKSTKSGAADTDFLRFFAGCDMGEVPEPPKHVPEDLPEEKETEETEEDLLKFSFYVFYPNNYSGVHDTPGSKVEAIPYLLAGSGAQKSSSQNLNDNETDVAISMKQLFESDGVGYEMLKVVKNGSFTHEPTYNEVRDSNCAFGISNVQRYLKPDVRVKDNPSIKNISDTFSSTVPTTLNSGSFPEDSINPDLTWEEITNNHIKGTRPNWQSYKSKTYIPSNQGLKNWDGYDYIPWYYRIDGKYKVPNGETETFENYYDQFLEYYRIDKVQNNAVVFSNYRDSQTYGLNCDIDMVKTAFQIKDDALSSNKETLYSLAEIAYAITDNQQIQDKIIEQGLILSENNAIERIDQLKNILKYSKSSGDIQNDYEIVKIEALGYSNSHANNASININKNRNDHLAANRAKTVVKWLKQNLPNLDENVFNVGVTEVQTSPSTSVGAEPNGLNDVSQLKAKQYRSAKITIYVKQNIDKDFKAKKNLTYDLGGETITVDTTKSLEIDGMMFAPTSDGKHYCHITDKSLWVNENGVMKKVTINKTEANSKDNEPIIAEIKNSNILRYDNESQFFRELQIKDPIVFSKLVDKLQVFDPAFHSMTPEGFNARLTFLHQCTRQGDTHTLSDTNRTHTPKNLQFGKAPVCILRLGDFYHQQILINSMSISFDETTWDLNTEGIGVQPMIANVNLSIIFIGGGDLAGAVQRLQNAATFNYYANTRLYDNRADRVVYEEGNTGVIDTKRTYSHNVSYAGIDTNKK